MDPFGCHIDYLRISVTARCTECCLYRMPVRFVELMPLAPGGTA